MSGDNVATTLKRSLLRNNRTSPPISSPPSSISPSPANLPRSLSSSNNLHASLNRTVSERQLLEPSEAQATAIEDGPAPSETLPEEDPAASTEAPPAPRRSSFGLNFLSSITSSIRPYPVQPARPTSPRETFMSNSPTIANLNHITSTTQLTYDETPDPIESQELTVTQDSPQAPQVVEGSSQEAGLGADKDGLFSIRLTPLIDHSSTSSGLYFAPIIRRIKPDTTITIGRYTEKNKSAAHAPQGSSAPIVFKSKVVSRTHALFQCNEDGQWFLKDCKSSSGTFLNHVRLSRASEESTLMPLIDGDIIQLGMDYRGGTEEVYRCVKMRCEFNKSWQRKVNQFNLEIHQKLKNLALGTDALAPAAPAQGPPLKDEFSECVICLLKLEPCQALFISPCSHAWHYKCIRPIIIKSYPQFYCPNCRSMCDLETDIEDDE